MIEKFRFEGEDYAPVFKSDTWLVALLRYSERFSKATVLERHLETDEVFVLLSGEATLYTEDESRVMRKNTVYNIPKGVWHHIVVSPDATVLVAENSNTTKENSEKRPWHPKEDEACSQVN